MVIKILFAVDEPRVFFFMFIAATPLLVSISDIEGAMGLPAIGMIVIFNPPIKLFAMGLAQPEVSRMPWLLMFALEAGFITIVILLFSVPPMVLFSSCCRFAFTMSIPLKTYNEVEVVFADSTVMFLTIFLVTADTAAVIFSFIKIPSK